MQVVVCVECPSGALMKHFQPVADSELKLLSVFIDALMQKIITLTITAVWCWLSGWGQCFCRTLSLLSFFFGTLEAIFHHQPPITVVSNVV